MASPSIDVCRRGASKSSRLGPVNEAMGGGIEEGGTAGRAPRFCSIAISGLKDGMDVLLNFHNFEYIIKDFNFNLMNMNFKVVVHLQLRSASPHPPVIVDGQDGAALIRRAGRVVVLDVLRGMWHPERGSPGSGQLDGRHDATLAGRSLQLRGRSGTTLRQPGGEHIIGGLPVGGNCGSIWLR